MTWKRLRYTGLKSSVMPFDKTGIVRDLMTYWSMSSKGVLDLLESDDFRHTLLEWIENPLAVDAAFGVDQGIPTGWQRIYNQTRVLQFYQSEPNRIISFCKNNLCREYWDRLYSVFPIMGRLAVIGGIGTGALVLDRIGNEVHYIEIQGKHREFAEWRFCLQGYKHGANISVRNSLGTLTGLDGVMIECLHTKTLLSVVAGAMANALKPEGLVVVTDNFKAKGMEEDFEDAMIDAGFEKDTNCWRKQNDKA